jgi:hypothetical protein
MLHRSTNTRFLEVPLELCQVHRDRVEWCQRARRGGGLETHGLTDKTSVLQDGKVLRLLFEHCRSP